MEVLLVSPMLLLMTAYLVYVATCRKPVTSTVRSGLWKELTLLPASPPERRPSESFAPQESTASGLTLSDAERLTQELDELRTRIDQIASRIDQLAQVDGRGTDRKAA